MGTRITHKHKTYMIDYIKGQISELNPTYAVLEAAGVGYYINITLGDYSTLLGHDQKQDAKLYTTEIIREDTHDLFGFITKGEREIFVLLMTVSGIGANTARMILSAFSASEVRQLIATGNSKQLSQVKGLGPKTAQRIIVDLKDKVLKITLDENDANTPVVPSDQLFDIPEPEVKTEAVSALAMLGFAVAASSKVVDKILKSDPNACVEQVIKLALKML